MDATAEAPPSVGAVPAAGPFVPPRALWAAGAGLALLVVALVGNWLRALDIFHVDAGGLWTGIAQVMGFVIGPIMARLEIPARIAVARRLMPMMLVIMPTLVLMTLTSGWQLARVVGNLTVAYPERWWLVASYVVVGVMAVIAYAVLEPANIVVLLELRKPRPNGALIGRLMRRFIYTAGVTGVMQVATLVIMTRIATW